MSDFDIAIIGSGPGGYVCAIRAAQLGLSVCCIEKSENLGGTCLNVGCIPSKSLLHTSYLYKQTKDLSKIGISVSNVQIDIKKMLESKNESVSGLTDGIKFLFNKNKIVHKKGLGRISNSNEIEVLSDNESEFIKAKNIVIATGSEVSTPKDILLDEIDILSSTGALNLSAVPNDLVIIGAGYIGLELGSVWSRLGSKVTVIEFADRILPGMDSEVSKNFQKILIKQGFDFKLSTALRSIAKKNGKTYVTVETKGQSMELACEKVLISTGRKAYTYGLNLDQLNIEVDNHGRVETNELFQTKIKNIYAIGDCRKGPMLAHKASEEGIAVAEIISGQVGQVNYNTIPSVIYTSPEVASVGKTEEQLKSENKDYKVGKFPFLANSRAKVNNETDGFVKILADSATDKVLGVHIIGAHCGNMIAEMALAMEFGASAEDIARTCHAHPTHTEAIKEAALAVDKRPIHF